MPCCADLQSVGRLQNFFGAFQGSHIVLPLCGICMRVDSSPAVPIQDMRSTCKSGHSCVLITDLSTTSFPRLYQGKRGFGLFSIAALDFADADQMPCCDSSMQEREAIKGSVVGCTSLHIHVLHLDGKGVPLQSGSNKRGDMLFHVRYLGSDLWRLFDFLNLPEQNRNLVAGCLLISQ